MDVGLIALASRLSRAQKTATQPTTTNTSSFTAHLDASANQSQTPGPVPSASTGGRAPAQAIAGDSILALLGRDVGAPSPTSGATSKPVSEPQEMSGIPSQDAAAVADLNSAAGSLATMMFSQRADFGAFLADDKSAS